MRASIYIHIKSRSLFVDFVKQNPSSPAPGVKAHTLFQKIKVDNDQEMAQPERNSNSKNRGGKN